MMERKKFCKLLGYRLRRLREEGGYTQFKLAELAALHPNYISAVERGTKCPSIYQLLKISEALNIEISEMLEEI